jgi:hypothetical protein
MRSKEEQEQIVKRALSKPIEVDGKPDVSQGPVIAYLIASEVLGVDIWLAFDDDFNPGDGLVIFYPDELPFLATKDAETLREIHKYKLVNRGGRVRQ